jgi:pilus assembly protein CpaF
MRLDDVVASVCDRVRRGASSAGPVSLREHVHREVDAVAPLLTPVDRRIAVERSLASLTGLGVLEPFLTEPDVSEVVVNSGREIWVDRSGVMCRAGDIAPGEIEAVVERVIAPLGLRFDRTSPIVDARLADGARLCAVLPPLAVDGTTVSIRRFLLRDVRVDAFAPGPIARLLGQLVSGRANVLVSGATSSGKTTFLNALARLIPDGERIITVEDTAELRLHAAHVVRLEARQPNADGLGAVTIRDLVRAALRLRPDRLVIGEIRGPEAFDAVQAMNTGHDGSLTTIHANSPDDALRRLTALAVQGAPAQTHAALVDQVRSSIDVVVHLARHRSGLRCVEEVAEVGPPGGDGPLTQRLSDGCTVGRRPLRLRLSSEEAGP